MNSRSRTNMKIAGVAAALLAIVVGVVALGIYIFGVITAPPPPDPEIAEREEVRDYLASDEFGKLDDDEKKEYMDKLRAEGKFRRGPRREEGEEPTEEEKAQRQKIRENVGPVMRKMMEDRVKKYFELPEQERLAYLDDMIDKMEERRRERQAEREANGEEPKERPKGEERGPGRGPGGRGGPTPDRMKQRIETTDPVVRAQMTEFREAMRARVEERRAIEESLRD